MPKRTLLSSAKTHYNHSSPFFSALPRLWHQNVASFSKDDRTAWKRCNLSKKILKFWNGFIRDDTSIRTAMERHTMNELRRRLWPRHPPISEKLRAQGWKNRKRHRQGARMWFRAVRQTNQSPLIPFRIGREKSPKRLDWSWGFTQQNKNE